MSVLSIIIGILLVICGFACIFTPLSTFLAAGFYLLVLLLVYGILGIARYSQKRSGVLDLIVSILAIIVAVFCLIHPGKSLEFNGLILVLAAIWLVIQGIVTIFTSIGARKELSGWGWGVFVGILAIRDAYSILYMENGDVKEIGNHETLMAQNGKYAALYNSQFA